MLHRKAKLGPHVAVSLKSLGLRVLLVQPASVVGVGPANPHAALVVKHGQEALLFALDQVQTVLKACVTEKNEHIVKLGGWSSVPYCVA